MLIQQIYDLKKELFPQDLHPCSFYQLSSTVILVTSNLNQDKSIDTITFEDGSQFPERNELTNVGGQNITNTIFFPDRVSSSRAYTHIWMLTNALEGRKWTINRQFKIKRQRQLLFFTIDHVIHIIIIEYKSLIDICILPSVTN